MGRKSMSEGTFVKNNIRVLREKLGITATELSERAGISNSQISRIELQKRRVSLDVADRIAAAMNVSRSAIVGGANPGSGTIVVEVRGIVQAGVWAETTELPPEDRYEVTVLNSGNYPGIDRIACIVVGNSMNKVFPDGTILIWVPFIQIREPLIPGKRYIVNRTAKDGCIEHTVKTYMRDKEGRDWFYPESYDAEFQVPIALDDKTGEIESIEVIGKVVKSQRDE